MFAKLKKLITHNGEKTENAAIELKKNGDKHAGEERFEQAVEYYRQALSISPEFSEALIGIGFALIETGSHDEAARHLQQALSIKPDNVDAHFMLGNIAREKGDLRRAIDHYSKAIKINPGFSFAYRKLFETHQMLGETAKAKEVLELAMSALPGSASFLFERAGLYFAEKDYRNAITLLQKALKITPDNVAFHLNIAKSYIESGQVEKAIPHLEQAAKHRPDDAAIHESLGNAYIKVGNKQAALVCLNEVVRIEPDSPFKHLVAAFSGLTTSAAPAKYVEELFDHYAENFESHLLQSLNYNVPDRLVSLIQSYRELEAGKLNVLDLGCGTGLFGRAVSRFADQIVGVDLSSKMLEKAAELGVYQRLERQDVVEMMRGEAPESYDLIAATDVFVYVGALDGLVAEAKRILRGNGLFAFSAESLEALSESMSLTDAGDFLLNDTGRFVHAIKYLNRLAKEFGFDVLETKEEPCRQEKGEPIMGYLVLWGKSEGD